MTIPATRGAFSRSVLLAIAAGPSIAGSEVPVHFVDLGVKERACLSLSNRDIDAFMFKHNNNEMKRVRKALSDLCSEVRERVWVARVLSRDEWPVLFVCGAEHAVSVSALFKCIGVQATVICRDFDPDAIPQ